MDCLRSSATTDAKSGFGPGSPTTCLVLEVTVGDTATFSFARSVRTAEYGRMPENSEAIPFTRGVTSYEVRCWSCGYAVVPTPEKLPQRYPSA